MARAIVEAGPDPVKKAAPFDIESPTRMTIGTEPRYFGTPDDLAGNDPTTDIGNPGQFPFTRGIQPTMYRGRPWTMRQYAGFADAAESNRRYRYLLSQGVSGLS